MAATTIDPTDGPDLDFWGPIHDYLAHRVQIFTAGAGFMLAAFAVSLLFLPWQASAVLLAGGLLDVGFLIQSRRSKRALETRIPALKTTPLAD